MIGAPLPYVAGPIEDRERAHRVAAEAVESWGLRIDLDAPLGTGMNLVFGGPSAVVRVGRTTAPARAAHDLAEALMAADIPAPAPLEGMAADIDGLGVSAWQRVRETRRPIDWEATGAAVRRVHELSVRAIPDEYPLTRPLDFPWWSLEELFAQLADHIDRPALDRMRRVVDEDAGALAALDTEQVVCHGDVHHNNVLMSGGGPVLIDWDAMCWAHPMWDHAFLLEYGPRWGGPPHTYDAFASGYGRSYRGDEHAEAVAEVRNVAATLLRVRAGLNDPAAAEEAERRLRYWRGDPDAPMWNAQ